MGDGTRKGAVVVAKHGKSAPRRRAPAADGDSDWRSFILLRWERGFTDARLETSGHETPGHVLMAPIDDSL